MNHVTLRKELLEQKYTSKQKTSELDESRSAGRKELLHKVTENKISKIE